MSGLSSACVKVADVCVCRRKSRESPRFATHARLTKKRSNLPSLTPDKSAESSINQPGSLRTCYSTVPFLSTKCVAFIAMDLPSQPAPARSDQVNQNPNGSLPAVSHPFMILAHDMIHKTR
jgi:hypothetical protein